MSFRKIFSGLFSHTSRSLGHLYKNTPSQNPSLASLGPPVYENSRFLGGFYKNISSLASLGPPIYERAETGVFLDIENCDVSENEAYTLRQKIEKTLQKEGYKGVVRICVVGNMELEATRRVAYNLIKQGVEVFHIHPNQKKPKEASDKLLIVKMFTWAMDQKGPGNLMLISGDGDYADSLLELQKRGFNIMLAMSCPALAQLLSNTLYLKRFFPYYAFHVLGGLDEEGKGCVFTYDALGSCERVGYGAQGSGSTFIMPFLDSQLKSPSPLLRPAQDFNTPLSEAEAVDLVKVVFASATERDIYTGDKLEIMILKADGIKTETMDLRID